MDGARRSTRPRRAAQLAGAATLLWLTATACSDGNADEFVWGRNPSWAGPTGARVVYAQNLSTPSDRFTATVSPLDTGAIFSIAADGSDARQLTQPGRGPDFFPVASPDGTQIAFVSADSGQFDVWVMAADGSGRRQLTFDRATDTTPSWTPDGLGLLFVSDRAGSADVWRIGLDGSGLAQVTSLPSDEASPRVSPDGARVVFASNQDRGNFDLWLLDLAGGAPRQLTSKVPAGSNVADGNPSWSPDGARIAFERWDGNWDVWRIDADGTGLTQLTNVRDHDGDPAYSPDGTTIAFTSARDGWWQIWLMDPDGGGLRQLTGDR